MPIQKIPLIDRWIIVWKHWTYLFSRYKKYFLVSLLIALFGLLLFWISMIYDLLTPLLTNLLPLFLLPIAVFYFFLIISGAYVFDNTPEKRNEIRKRKKMMKEWEKKNKSW